MIDMGCPAAAAGNRATVAVTLQRRPPQRFPMLRRVIAVSRQCEHPKTKPGTSAPTEAFLIARREGRTLAERVQIYEREVKRL
jgi:hypothetical protein